MPWGSWDSRSRLAPDADRARGPFLPYWAGLFLTVLVEAPLAALVAGSRRRRPAATLSVLLNLASHPLGYLIVRRGLCSWGGVELAVTALEALGYASILRIGWRRALIMSMACNAVTAGLSLVIDLTG